MRAKAKQNRRKQKTAAVYLDHLGAIND